MPNKLQKVCADIERTKIKTAELQALLPALEKQREALENTEVIKAFRTANVAPADFTAFIEACKTRLPGGALPIDEPATRPDTTEVMEHEKEV